MILESVPAGMILEGTQIGHPGFHTQGHEIPGSQLGYPRSDIPDSIRRDMKSQDLSWGYPDRTSRIPYAGT